MCPALHKPTHPASSGFTLVEAAVAIAVMSILLVGTGAAITMSVSAADKNDDPNTRFTQTADVMDRFMADVQSATEIVERTPRAITVTVPDRSGDGTPDLIRYSWSGSSGGVLLRSINNGPAVTMLSPVNAFTVSPLLRAARATTDSAEQLLLGFDTSPGASLRSQTVSDKGPAAQYLKPAFDSTVTSWKITRIKLVLMRDVSPTGTLRVSIVQANNWLPTGSVLATIDIPESALPAAFASYELALATSAIDPRQGVFIKLESVGGASGTTSATAQFGQGGTSMPYNTYLTTSGDYGATWTAPQDVRDICFQAYGIITSRN